MMGKASDAKAAEGNAPIFAYITNLPQLQRSIGERVDALAAKTLPDLKRPVNWGMAYCGVAGGWCFSSGAFVGRMRLMFHTRHGDQTGAAATPIEMGKSTWGIELAALDELDERQTVSRRSKPLRCPSSVQEANTMTVGQAGAYGSLVWAAPSVAIRAQFVC